MHSKQDGEKRVIFLGGNLKKELNKIKLEKLDTRLLNKYRWELWHTSLKSRPLYKTKQKLLTWEQGQWKTRQEKIQRMIRVIKANILILIDLTKGNYDINNKEQLLYEFKGCTSV